MGKLTISMAMFNSYVSHYQAPQLPGFAAASNVAADLGGPPVSHQFPLEKVVDFTKNWLSMMGMYGISWEMMGIWGCSNLMGH